MSLWTIVLRSLAQRRLSSILTAASIALGVAVTVAVLALKAQAREGFRQSAVSHDLVVGAKGSRLQLVLNTVFHLDRSPGNIPRALADRLATDRRVKSAVPISLGDVHQGHRVVATTNAFFDGLPLAAGALFKGEFQAVLGSRVAGALGSKLQVRHGGETGETHAETWTVVGTLAPTGTAVDRAIYIDFESFYHIAEHAQPDQISAVLVRTRGFSATKDLAFDLNRGTEAMAVEPAEVVVELFEMVGQIDILLLAVAGLVIAVAAVSILVSIYNSMAERRRSIAIMRALGARRLQILSIVVLEAKLLSLIGGAAGLLLGHLLVAAAGGVLAARAGVAVSAWAVRPEEFLVLIGVVALGGLAGVIPAVRAYRTDIADGLSPTS
ncbi:MAG TPA: ABC transporter permease [Planctomycetota bacterium]